MHLCTCVCVHMCLCVCMVVDMCVFTVYVCMYNEKITDTLGPANFTVMEIEVFLFKLL